MFYFIIKIINSAYMYNYHKLFCCIVVAFCAIVLPLVFLMYYGCFCFVCFLPFYCVCVCVCVYTHILFQHSVGLFVTLVRFY